MRSLTIKEISTELNLKVITGEEYINKCVNTSSIIRPGLELAGFFGLYDSNKVLLFGSREMAYLNSLKKEKAEKLVDKLIATIPSFVVFSLVVEPPVYILRICDTYKVPVLKGDLRTTSLFSKISSYLQDKLAPRKLVHGVLLDIHGMGTLITGESGIGKSEIALELIRKGFQLIADDRVDIFQKEVGILIGESPDVTKRYLEIRGIGIVDVLHLFGVGAFRESKKIRLVVHLEKWDNNKVFDRLGTTTDTIKFFDTEITKITIPVSPGRNTASLVEAAALNMKLKYMGYDGYKDFLDKVENLINERKCEK